MPKKNIKKCLLRVVRESMGISLRDMAKISGISSHNLWRAEVGRPVSEEMANKIAEVLAISPDIVYYNMGRIPPHHIDNFRKDPLFFKDLIDEACSESWRLTKTSKFMDNLIEKKNAVSVDVKKLLSHLKPTE